MVVVVIIIVVVVLIAHGTIPHFPVLKGFAKRIQRRTRSAVVVANRPSPKLMEIISVKVRAVLQVRFMCGH
jgi:hypothetical protein